jgi:hypothetical protein
MGICVITLYSSSHQKYRDLLKSTVSAREKLPNSAAETICTMSSFYWGCVIFHRRMLGGPGPLDEIHRDAIKNIIDIAYVYYRKDRRRIVRLTWPIFLSAIETNDAIHRDWLLERLMENRALQSEYAWASRVAEEIVRLQMPPQRDWVDLALFMQRG